MKSLEQITPNPYYESYNKETKTYYHRRDAGLYSILTWAVRKIFLLEINGYEVENIVLEMSAYLPKIDAYKILFQKKDIKIDFSNIPEEDKIFFETQVETCGWGLENFEKVNLQITNQIINKFFSPSQEVIDTYERLLLSNNINLDKTTFIWARNTDKVETHLPEAKNYLNVLNEINKESNELIIQTDDYRVIENFEKIGVEFKTIKEIPISGNLTGFHNEMKETNEKLFHLLYNQTKEEHLIQMYCLSLFCVNSDKSIVYPGNPTTYLLFLKGSSENLYLFKNSNELFLL